ncbi:hypothetical protein AN169_11805 [Staphylococcus aureus]|nr:hypothetical protein AN169_11805 [Staphylococcus aureus]
MIDEVLETFKIKRSLSTKGCPYDNAVAEATMKAMKIEFVKQMQFENLEQLETELFDYVNWYNNFRLNSSLQYLTAVAFKKSTHENCLKKNVDVPASSNSSVKYSRFW